MNRTNCFGIALLLALAALFGCCDPVTQEYNQAADTTPHMQPPKVLDLYSDLAIQNAIVTQCTIYPYHFAANSAALNTLGRRDLQILISHFVRYPGELTVRRGEEHRDLYQARLGTISSLLGESGVDLDKVRISDGAAGGTGISTSDLIDALARSREPFRDDSGSYAPVFTTQP
jgi:hypothetical protein